MMLMGSQFCFKNILIFDIVILEKNDMSFVEDKIFGTLYLLPLWGDMLPFDGGSETFKK